jgi:cyclic pyranopterin phosphate synthase
LPDGYRCESKKTFLSVAEINNLVSAFAELGSHKVRITGGEPTTRKDFVEIIKQIKAIDGIEQIAVTTNGYKLEQSIQHWVEAGLTHLNVSIDSLDRKTFHDLTGHNRLETILQGVDQALELPIQRIKLNAVLLKNINSHQFHDYARLLKNKPISVRFIELMRTGDNEDYFNRFHVSAQVLKNYLLSNGWIEKLREASAGPAIEYCHPDYQGTFGVIAPYSKNFCDNCNRLRVSAEGKFHLCLFGEQGYDIRHLLQCPSQRETLKQNLCAALTNKPDTHFLHDGKTGVTTNLSFIGG